MSSETKEEKDYRGFDVASESYYFYDDIWKVDKDCKIPPKFGTLEELVDVFEDITKKLKEKKIEKKEALSISRKCTRDILELTLIGFKYDEMIKKHGYIGLDLIAVDMIHLFLKIGGMEELRLRLKRAGVIPDGLSGLED